MKLVIFFEDDSWPCIFVLWPPTFLSTYTKSDKIKLMPCTPPNPWHFTSMFYPVATKSMENPGGEWYVDLAH